MRFKAGCHRRPLHAKFEEAFVTVPAVAPAHGLEKLAQFSQIGHA